ncbi:hypothetical protein TanjilG_13453 [Lupinus angustifolius]|uniref:CCT domain-containing protein n=1 Tax=Lupinus angustifolius TaxID=3871 RepID=A0A4P1RV78_LUPAN|nr:PREDICTED: protein CHLOROPLAST IMPORT APPARATUS 2-like [Lupinus angustifolius]OIW18701.1 hypothetical protein TanjilG_13453 [Lupinus angustifolius]
MCGGGGKTYGLDLEFLKPCSFSVCSSSPSSTISESSNSAITISTTKPRTRRKRPNQNYNEAAALLSTAYPNLFSSKTLKTQPSSIFFNEDLSSEVLLPFRVLDSSSSFLLDQCKASFSMKPKVVMLQEKLCQSPGEINSASAMNNSVELEDDYGEVYDAESILDEEIGEGIDSIMGSLTEKDTDGAVSCQMIPAIDSGGKLDCRLGLKRALRDVDDGGNWWNLPAVDIVKISPKIVYKSPPPAVAEKKKKRKKVEVKNPEPVAVKENPVVKSDTGLMLKLNYNEVKNAWSDKGSPFADDSPVSGASVNDVTARLSQIDLLWDNGSVREASVLRYKEKRHMRLLSNKIRCQVRKVNADQRPRLKVPPS